MSTTPIIVSHDVHSPLTSWRSAAGPETALQRLGFLEAPKIVCSLLDDSVDNLAHASVPGSDSDFSTSSSSSSSPKSNRSSFPDLTSDNYPVIKADDSDPKCYGFEALSFNDQIDVPPLNHNHNELNKNLEKYCHHHAVRSPVRFSPDRPSYSTRIVVNLTYPDNSAMAHRAPKRGKMDVKAHFQVLIGSLAQSLAILPELLELTIEQNSQLIKLSPIASPHQLGFSSDLTIQVWVKQPTANTLPVSTNSYNQPRRIPGTKWIHSFTSKKYKFGLPSSPKYSANLISV